MDFKKLGRAILIVGLVLACYGLYVASSAKPVGGENYMTMEGIRAQFQNRQNAEKRTQSFQFAGLGGVIMVVGFIIINSAKKKKDE